MKACYFIDVSTLMETAFTGIPNVVCQLVMWCLQNRGSDLLFFDGSDIISRDVVERIVAAKTGLAVGSANLIVGSIYDELGAHSHFTTVGLFGGIKRVHGIFDYEAQILYDLTYVVMPEAHHHHTISAHGRTIQRDVATNDLNVCISEWTKNDLIDYVGARPEACMVSYLGCDAVDEAPRLDVEPYYLMLGTIEPRKNHAIVLEAVRKRPDLLRDSKLVIAGRHGWGPTFAELMRVHGLEQMSGNQVRWLGYCSDAVRARLLKNARALLYPSLYEGFGLPVLEAMAVGTPVVTSASSSLPEVAGQAAFYADPGVGRQSHCRDPSARSRPGGAGARREAARGDAGPGAEVFVAALLLSRNCAN